MSATWKKDAHRLAASIARVTSVTPSETWLTERLVEFQYVPPNPDAAPMSLLISELGVTFEAGRGLRVELDGPAISAVEVESLATAVVAGHLSEVVAKRQVAFVLRRAGLPAIKGTSSYLGGKLPPPHNGIDYAPYQPLA
jgi:hypothetical protein